MFTVVAARYDPNLTSNQVRLRGAFFGVSALVLAVMWIIFMVGILTAPWV